MNAIYGVFDNKARNILKDIGEIESSLASKYKGTYLHSNFEFCTLGTKNSSKNNHFKFKEYIITSSLRLDQKNDLCSLLGISLEHEHSDNCSYLVLLAYLKWDAKCVNYLNGDWVFAIYNNLQKELFISSDPMGNNSVYFQFNGGKLRFSSSLRGLIAGLTNWSDVNENYLFTRLVGTSPPTNESIYKNIFALPPGTNLQIDKSGKLNENRYYKLEKTEVIELNSIDDYLDSFLTIFKSAISKRIPKKGKIGSSLSGGLDSSSVSAMTAIELNNSKRDLTAFTSVPYYNLSHLEARNTFFDESHLAQLTAARYENIELCLMNSPNSSIINSIKKSLDITDQPLHGLANIFWIDDIYKNASHKSISTFFIGHAGNATISWFGVKPKKKSSLFRRLLLKSINIIKKNTIKRNKHLELQPLFNQKFHDRQAGSVTFSRKEGPISSVIGFTERCNELQIRIPISIFRQEMSLFYDLDILDPTRDKQLSEFCLSIPDHFYRNESWDRLLVRKGLKDYLPKEVLWNKKRGKQGSDIAVRINDEKQDFIKLILEFRHYKHIQKYLNLDSLLEHLIIITTEPNSSISLRLSNQFLRAMGVGLFLQRFEE